MLGDVDGTPVRAYPDVLSGALETVGSQNVQTHLRLTLTLSQPLAAEARRRFAGMVAVSYVPPGTPTLRDAPLDQAFNGAAMAPVFFREDGDEPTRSSAAWNEDGRTVSFEFYGPGVESPDGSLRFQVYCSPRRAEPVVRDVQGLPLGFSEGETTWATTGYRVDGIVREVFREIPSPLPSLAPGAEGWAAIHADALVFTVPEPPVEAFAGERGVIVVSSPSPRPAGP